MKNIKYYVSEWALRRQAELIDLPEDFPIHPDYVRQLPKEQITAALRIIHKMLFDVFQDIAEHPECFSMPLVEIRTDNLTKYGFPPPKAQSSKRAAYMFLDALINVLISGTIRNNELEVVPEKLLAANKNDHLSEYKAYAPKSYTIKNVDKLYSQFDRYGLYLEGLKNYRPVPCGESIHLSFPDNPDVLTVLKWMADKAHEHNRRQEFMVCNYRLLQDDRNTFHYTAADYLADKMHTQQEKECVYRFDSAMQEKGLLSEIDNRGEMPGEDNYAVFYYFREKDKGNRSKAGYKLSSQRTKLQLGLRIKCIQNCAGYIENSPDEIKSIFIPGDTGCDNRAQCTRGQAYILDGREYWHCACSGGLFTMRPEIRYLSDYINLVEIGK
ncbi:hypothetical protein [Eisenbergiella sp.]|uniref:hypothetical protein n=1 Tax=Eisenbergiella sp. TaxID=1924109 RepID=UPI0020836C7A|nr:hypothetical protein [Eisenbergiella sp.]BDF47830.1 hypothetical protein CE91St56_49530 [Lachnospiraceae bacterium]GKH43905.1 hypothetical protein CE91St57_48790 [Lachnospiraceae bacterium]